MRVTFKIVNITWTSLFILLQDAAAAIDNMVNTLIDLLQKQKHLVDICYSLNITALILS